MPTPKLFFKQLSSESDNNYLFLKYWDNKNNNWEYQVYQLAMAKPVCREFGAPELNESGGYNNSRVMCDWVWDNIPEIESSKYSGGKK